MARFPARPMTDCGAHGWHRMTLAEWKLTPAVQAGRIGTKHPGSKSPYRKPRRNRRKR